MGENSEPLVLCIIVNWNGGADTKICLEHLAQVSYKNCEIVVVDNGSTDDSVQQIREAHKAIPIIECETNRGFSAGNNAGIRYALSRGADYVWLLNNDTKPHADALRALVAKGEQLQGVGAVASVIYDMNQPDNVQTWGGGHVNTWTGYCSRAVAPVSDEWCDYLAATSILIRRAALLSCGLLDEGYFAYWEDTEYSYRLRRCGWTLAVANESKVAHKENASTASNPHWRVRLSTASAIRFLRQNSRFPAVSVGIFVILRLGKRLLTGQFDALRSVIAGCRDSVSSLRQPSSVVRRK